MQHRVDRKWLSTQGFDKRQSDPHQPTFRHTLEFVSALGLQHCLSSVVGNFYIYDY